MKGRKEVIAGLGLVAMALSGISQRFSSHVWPFLVKTDPLWKWDYDGRGRDGFLQLAGSRASVYSGGGQSTICFQNAIAILPGPTLEGTCLLVSVLCIDPMAFLP